MFAKTSLVLTLILSLLFVTQAPSWTLPVEMKADGACAKMQCATGCCAKIVCCKVTEQQKAPQTPTPASSDTHVQVAAIDLREYTLLFIPPVPRRPFVMLDEARPAHTLSRRAVSCIQLI